MPGKTSPPAADPRPGREPGYPEAEPRDGDEARQPYPKKPPNPDDGGLDREADAED